MTTRSQSFGVVSNAIDPNDIFAGDFPVVTQSILLAAGTGSLTRGTVLGKLTKDTAVAAKVSGNGNGDIAAAAVTLGAQAQVGVYTLTCTAASTGAGTFSVRAPNGLYLPDLTVASAYATQHINLTVPDGTTDWGVGAVCTVTVSGTGQYAPYDATPTAYDGRELPDLILAENIDLDSDEETACVAYRTGSFRRAALTGIDDGAVPLLDARSIFVR